LPSKCNVKIKERISKQLKKMANEKFCLRWNDFESNISSAFRELREDKDFFDVTLACEDEQLQAHKVILSACSPFFRTVLRRNRHEHPLLYLKGVKYADLVSVLNFMYHGEVNVAQEELNSFLAIAEELKVKGLTQNNSGGSSSSSKNPPPSKPPSASHHRPSPAPQSSSHLHTSTPPPPKRPRPTPPVAAPSIYQEDPDEIQEVAPAAMVKEEPRQHHQVAMEEQQQQEVIDNSGAMEQYGAEGDYGEYEGYEGDYDQGGMGDASMVGADGNKELNLSLDRLIEQSLDGEGKLWHKCVSCGKMMKQKDKLRRHVEVHMGWSLPCPICGEVCKTRNGLSHHHARVHRSQM